VVTPVATGVGAFGFFYGCALVVRQIPFLEAAISRVLVFAEEGSMPLVLLTTYANGVGEEVFFRGALYATLPREQAVVTSTGVYMLATLTTRNPSLVIAALFMGGLFAMQRRATGGLQAPLLTHLTWSTLMVRYLPPLFRHAQRVLG
jgi:membrane protease YdiL (CAAX protease family)